MKLLTLNSMSPIHASGAEQWSDIFGPSVVNIYAASSQVYGAIVWKIALYIGQGLALLLIFCEFGVSEEMRACLLSTTSMPQLDSLPVFV